MARIVGIVLVALGAAALGWQGVSYASVKRDESGVLVRQERQAIWVPPAVSGIAVVSGLLVLASGGRREEL